VGNGHAGCATRHHGLRSDAQAGKVVAGTPAIAEEAWGARAPRRRFLLAFSVILVALFAAQLTPPAQSAFVLPWTEALARISGGLITFFDSNVIVFGKVLQSATNGFAISIEAGCNGIEAAIVLIAAMLAFPAPWKHRLTGIVVRVASLFYLGQWRAEIFEFAHLYVWQALIMFDVLIVWLIWMRTLPRRGEAAP
jgi:exosortase H (IPTLxxWG-CTERM-specific)